MKYIIFKRRGTVMPVVFNEFINHNDIRLRDDWTPVSAGFVYINDGKPQVDYSSESVSLKLKANEHDGEVLTACFKNYQLGAQQYNDSYDIFYPAVD